MPGRCWRGSVPTISHTIKNLRDTEDRAPGFGIEDIQSAHFPFDELGARDTGLGYQVLRAGKRSGVVHRHENAEEVYVILAGAGRMKIDDEVIEVGPRDAIRVDPTAVRAFEAGDEDLEILAFGPRHANDGEVLDIDFWGG